MVALAIPRVLAMTFVALEYLGISLQRISLGALIIALGLLADDAMIAVEMMVSRLEQGDRWIIGDLFLYLDRVSDARRNAGDGGQLPADRDEQQHCAVRTLMPWRPPIAQRFNAGFVENNNRVPAGTKDATRDSNG